MLYNFSLNLEIVPAYYSMPSLFFYTKLLFLEFFYNVIFSLFFAPYWKLLLFRPLVHTKTIL